MSLLLHAIAVAGGVWIGRWLVRIGRSSRQEPARKREEGPAAPGETRADEASEEVAVERIDWTLFPCALGDVVVRTADGDEAWLAGAIVLREDVPVAALFVAPEAGGDRALYVRARPAVDVAWLRPVLAETLGIAREPPSAIEIGGVRYDRVRRLPLHAARVGTGGPEVGDRVVIGEYGAGAGEVAIVIADDAGGRAWTGTRLAAGDYDVWKSGERR